MKLVKVEIIIQQHRNIWEQKHIYTIKHHNYVK